MSVQNEITQWLNETLVALHQEGILSKEVHAQVTSPKDAAHGNYTSNVALAAAAQTDSSAYQLAQKIIARLPAHEAVEKVEAAGPGFINFYVRDDLSTVVIRRLIKQGRNFARGRIRPGQQRILIEYVSANPTGPLHVGHGRGAAYGESVAEFFTHAGCAVEREYYVNDVGRQIDILTLSVWLRYLEIGGHIQEGIIFPGNCYQGDYVYDIAAVLRNRYGDALNRSLTGLSVNAAMTGAHGSQTNRHHVETLLDVLMDSSRVLLGSDYAKVREVALQVILQGIRRDLESFGVRYTNWFSEKTLLESGRIAAVVDLLQDKGVLYEKAGAIWFRSSDFGDDKDRVIKRENGQLTYFASDIAYHADKYARGYDRMINIWGADHHGYVVRLVAALKALGLDASRLTVFLVQFAALYRGSEKIPMSTRAGQFVTLRELCQEAGKDAARFFYIMRKPNQHMNFDLNLAKSASVDNPVYYVQYAHARIHSVFRQLEEKGMAFDETNAELEHLVEEEETGLIRHITSYEKTLNDATQKCEPQLLVGFLRELATRFHSYYNRHVFLVDDETLRTARMTLLLALRIVLANGLRLIGVSAPEKM